MLCDRSNVLPMGCICVARRAKAASVCQTRIVSVGATKFFVSDKIGIMRRNKRRVFFDLRGQPTIGVRLR